MILSWYHKAWDEYLDWRKEDKKILKKINSLIEDTLRNLTEGTVTILSCKTHYQ